MKYFLAGLSITIALVAFAYSDGKRKIYSDRFSNMSQHLYMGHSYVVLSKDTGCAMIHDPNCPCGKAR